MAQQQIVASIFEINLRTRTVALISLVTLAVVLTLPTAQAQTFNVLYSFTGGLDGSSPWGQLAMDRAGNFYTGTMEGGNDTGSGAASKLEPASGVGSCSRCMTSTAETTTVFNRKSWLLQTVLFSGQPRRAARPAAASCSNLGRVPRRPPQLWRLGMKLSFTRSQAAAMVVIPFLLLSSTLQATSMAPPPTAAAPTILASCTSWCARVKAIPNRSCIHFRGLTGPCRELG